MKINDLFYKKSKVLKGPKLIQLHSVNDERGYFYEKWNSKNFDKLLSENIKFVQDNISKSHKGVIRGMHYQLYPKAQSKLVSCLFGEIFDVALDIRKGSKTFGKWVGVFLNEQNKSQLWIPEGFAHGFITLSQEAIVHYKTTDYWSPVHERSIVWDDKDININWPISLLEGKKLITSNKDKKAKNFNQLIEKDLL